MSLVSCGLGKKIIARRVEGGEGRRRIFVLYRNAGEERWIDWIATKRDSAARAAGGPRNCDRRGKKKKKEGERSKIRPGFVVRPLGKSRSRTSSLYAARR